LSESRWRSATLIIAVFITGVNFAAGSLVNFNAEVLIRGRLTSVLAGELPYQLTVVIRFPDHATLQDWYRSDGYQNLIPIRDRAADVVIAAYEEAK
jgi:uncharacterized protein (DUF1330 family)